MERVGKVTFKLLLVHLATAIFGSIISLYAILLVSEIKSKHLKENLELFLLLLIYT